MPVLRSRLEFSKFLAILFVRLDEKVAHWVIAANRGLPDDVDAHVTGREIDS